MGLDKKNQVNNLKTLNILREGFFLRVDSEFIVEKSIFLDNVKTDKGIYPHQLTQYLQADFWSTSDIENLVTSINCNKKARDAPRLKRLMRNYDQDLVFTSPCQDSSSDLSEEESNQHCQEILNRN